MRRKNENDVVNKRKYLSIVGFIVSIILLSLAITLSMNEEKVAREAKLDREAINLKESGKSNITTIQKASSDINKNINEVKSQNTVKESKINSNVTKIDENMISASSNTVNTDNTNELNTSAVVQNNVNQSNNTVAIQDNSGDNEAKNGDFNSKSQFIMPVEGTALTGFSMDSLVYSNTLGEWVTHRGIDIKAEKTSIVKASASGEIKAIKDDPRYGLSIIIDHGNGYQTVYSSLLSTEFVKEGDTVEQGQAIGTVGNSAVFETAEGSHLHFEILKDGDYINPDIYVK